MYYCKSIFCQQNFLQNITFFNNKNILQYNDKNCPLRLKTLRHRRRQTASKNGVSTRAPQKNQNTAKSTTGPEHRALLITNTAYIRCLYFAIDQYYMSMSSIDLAFAKTLKQLRRTRHLTQEELAQRAGLDYKHLQKLEGKAPSSPTLSTLEKLAKGLDVSLTEFIALIDEAQRVALFGLEKKFDQILMINTFVRTRDGIKREHQFGIVVLNAGKRFKLALESLLTGKQVADLHVQARTRFFGNEVNFPAGFVAGSDSHQMEHGKEGGILGAFVRENTSQEVWSAIWNRRTYATTGARILLSLRMGKAFMGDEVTWSGERVFKAAVLSPGDIRGIELIRNGSAVYSIVPEGRDVDLEFTDDASLSSDWYYLRVELRDDQVAWSSPIFVN